MWGCLPPMAAIGFWKQFKQGARSAFEYIWGYMGTLAAMGLVVGVLGMGIFHTCTPEGAVPEYRCFSGLVNCASAEAPTGVDEIPQAVTGAHLRFEYEPDGRLARFLYINADGHRAAIPGSKVAEQRMEYDEHGRLIARRNYSAAGEATEDAAGISARIFRYDDAGRLIRTTLQNAQGVKIVPRMPGYAEECITYDGQGRPLRIRYLDGNGHPITNSAGECEVVFTYDDEHHRTERTNTIKGMPADNLAGIATERRDISADGATEMVSWLDKEGKPVFNARRGGAAVLSEHHVADNMQRERLCAESGVMPASSRTCTEHVVRTTPAGLLEWECYNAADGLPCDNARLGYAERVCEYDDSGNLTNEYFWDDLGCPCPCYEKRYTTSSDGRRHVLSLHTDGSTSVMPVEP